MHTMFPIHQHIPVLTNKETIVMQWLYWEYVQYYIKDIIHKKYMQLLRYTSSWFCVSLKKKCSTILKNQDLHVIEEWILL